MEKNKEIINKITNFSSKDMIKIQDEIETMGKAQNFRDGMNVKIVGIVSKVKKKFTKKNTIMAFVTIEDLTGAMEIILFDLAYSRWSNLLNEGNIVFIDGKLSIRDNDSTIIANELQEFSDDFFQKNSIKEDSKTYNYKKEKAQITSCEINITNLDEKQKERLRGAILFFSGISANIKVNKKKEDKIMPSGSILFNEAIKKEIENIVGENNIVIK